MYKRVLMMCLSVMLTVMMTTATFAEDVYVTKYGKKYHKENSRFIKNRDVEKLTREEAEELGYKPSSDFLKDDADTNEEDAAKEETVKEKKAEK